MEITKMFIDSLIEICSWEGVKGWQGVRCSQCGATHNILIGPGIKCESCGAFIGTSFSHYHPCYKKPDFGFNRSVIGWAMMHHSPHRHLFKPPTEMMEKLERRLAIIALKKGGSIAYCNWTKVMRIVAIQIGYKNFESICGDMVTPCDNGVWFISGVCYRLKQDWTG